MAAEVTDSYISQLLAKKKTPPAPSRTDIYGKLASVLKLPSKELSRLADIQRQEERKRKVLEPPRPLFQEFRELILRKCVAAKRKQIANIFEREPFGEFERFITQKLLDVSKRVTTKELEDEKWIHLVSRVCKRTHDQTRALILQFLDTDVFHVSVESCISFLEPLIQSWDIDFETFGMEIVLNRRFTRSHLKKLEFREAEPVAEIEPALKEFLDDPKLSADITEDEIALLKSRRFNGKSPSLIYYYRDLQNLRDPLNFPSVIPEEPVRAGSHSTVHKASVSKKDSKSRRVEALAWKDRTQMPDVNNVLATEELKRAGSDCFSPTPDAIAHLAHEFWKRRGSPLGSPEEDWFRAKQESSTTEVPVLLCD